ncbi:MAG: sensor histidine kinase, partial [Opitutaceae bacterium]
LAELAERTGSIGKLRCTFDCARPVVVHDPFTAGHLYRIAQEAVNNAVKHARARHVIIRLEETGGRLQLTVKDDGNGLPSGRVTRAEGIGLRVMRHRANVIGAQLAIDSRRGEGVAVRCSLPSPGK